MNITIFGHGNPVLQAIDSLQASEIKILNVEQDFIRKGEEQTNFESDLSKRGILLNNWEKVKDTVDMIFVINYNKIIDVRSFEGKKLINLHIGLLPRYRGNHANAWAVVNGEKEVGYTLHDVDEILDAGAIYYKFKYPVKNNETYYHAKEAMNRDISQNLAKNLLRIFKKQVIPKSQRDKKFVYCSKLRASDGVISDWNVKSEYLLRKQYVFSKPLGTGMKFRFKEQIFTIEQIERISDFDKAIGIPGGIVYMQDNALWVKTKDTAVGLRLSLEGETIEIRKYFKIGQRL